MTHKPEQAATPPPVEDEDEDEVDPFEQAAQRALAEDSFLRDRVGEALGGLRRLLPARGVRMAEELLVELFTEDPVVSSYMERLRPQVAPASTHERDVRVPGAPEPGPAESAKAAGGRGA